LRSSRLALQLAVTQEAKLLKISLPSKTLPAVLSGTDMSLIIVICDVYSCRSAFMHDLVSCHTKCCLNMQHNQISFHAKTMSQDIPAVTFHPKAYTFLYACFFLALVYYYLSRQPLNCRSHSA